MKKDEALRKGQMMEALGCRDWILRAFSLDLSLSLSFYLLILWNKQQSAYPPQLVVMVGSPMAMASMVGKPQPSPCVGSTKASADLYSAGISAAGKCSCTT